MRPNTGGPAFPRPASIDPTSGTLPDGDVLIPAEHGMSVRDWFAGQALAGLLAFSKGGDQVTEQYSTADAADHAYAFADAMIARREARLLQQQPQSETEGGGL